MDFGDFFDRLGDLNWLGVVVGAVLFIVVGALWYGPIVGKFYSAHSGIPRVQGVPEVEKLVAGFVYAFVVNIGIAYWGVLDDIQDALVRGIVLGILLIGGMLYSSVVWEKLKVQVWAVHTGFAFVAVTLSSYIQGLID